MAIIKCKMCGGDLDISEGLTVCECEYCGTKQTVPTVDDEKKITLFNRAGRLLRGCEFDKASGIFESIVADFPEESEAYWGLVLCKFGIEYVDDPATGKKVPTCHRSGFDSVMKDSDFEQACENADAIARRQYREEAKAIEELRRGIIEVSGKEEPYDIFICYKETDENGGRTVDSVIAQDVYDALTAKGYRVFFSRITLEDKLGQEYEPYIFAALNSAKVMLAFGTDFEYFNAVWVKNEWSRFLKLMAKDKTKHLIPCYKNIDAYDMPEEFARLQAQDMGKVGAVQDLLRGIEKLLPRKKIEDTLPQRPVGYSGGPNVTALLQRGNMALEDGEWDKAKEYFDQVLNMDAHCAEAYVGIAMAEGKCRGKEAFAKAYATPNKELDQNRNVVRAKQFGDTTLKAWFAELGKKLQAAREVERIERKRIAEEARIAQAEKAAEERIAQSKKVEERRLALTQLTSTRKQLKAYQGRIAVCRTRTLGVMSNGTVASTGGNLGDVSGWCNIAAVSASDSHVVGLKTDGTVLFAGAENYGTNISAWRDIVAISAGRNYTVGLRSDGTVVATGDNKSGQCNVSDWRNIVAITTGGSVLHAHTVGLKTDGRVEAVGFSGANNSRPWCDVCNWRDIVAISAGAEHTIGLKTNGTVVAAGLNHSDQCNVAGWRNIVAIAAGDFHTVGLCSDGTVLAVGKTEDGQCNVSDWKDIVAIAAGSSRTVGLKSDGTVVVAGNKDFGECNMPGLKLFKTETEKAADYAIACAIQVEATEEKLAEAAELFLSILDYQDSAERARQCQQEHKKLQMARVAREQEECEAKEAKKRANQEARECAAREARRAELTTEKEKLAAELPNLKGLFSGGKRKQIEARIAEIDAELAKL